MYATSQSMIIAALGHHGAASADAVILNVTQLLRRYDCTAWLYKEPFSGWLAEAYSLKLAKQRGRT